MQNVTWNAKKSIGVCWSSNFRSRAWEPHRKLRESVNELIDHVDE